MPDQREQGLEIVADDGMVLRGTLKRPDGPGPYRSVLLLPGSGRLDRNSNQKRVRIDLWAPLLTVLADHDIATLRYDKRGVGESDGSWAEAGFQQHRSDAAAALRTLAAQPRIDPARVMVIGHSEGALHAAGLAADHDVAGAVLLAGFAGTGAAALRWQARRVGQSLPGPLRLLSRPTVSAMERRIRRHSSRPQDPRSDWWRELIAHDVSADLSRITAPVLAITGDQDFQVNPDDLQQIAQLVGGPVETARPPGLTHLLRSTDGPASPLSYPRLLRRPTDPELVRTIVSWLDRQDAPGES